MLDYFLYVFFVMAVISGTFSAVRGIVFLNDRPSGTKRVGSAHTHAAYDPEYNNEVFSDFDRENANNRSIEDGGSTPNYLGTPDGQFKKFKPAAISNSTRGKVINLKPL